MSIGPGFAAARTLAPCGGFTINRRSCGVQRPGKSSWRSAWITTKNSELGGEPQLLLLLLLQGFNAGRTGCACADACPVPTVSTRSKEGDALCARDCAAALIDRRQSAGRDEDARRASSDPR